MTGEGYQKCMDWTEKYIGIRFVRILVKLLTAITAVCYSLTVLWLIFQRDIWVFRILVIPAVGFIAVSLIRKWLSASRPYEIYAFTPLLDKDTKGNSFPSRHVFSNMIIAMAVLSVWIPAGIFLIICGILLAVLRVITGVHFPKDVIAGAVFAAVLGVVGFFAFI